VGRVPAEPCLSLLLALYVVVLLCNLTYLISLSKAVLTCWGCQLKPSMNGYLIGISRICLVLNYLISCMNYASIFITKPYIDQVCIQLLYFFIKCRE
jgi:hypothetical protein